MIVGQRAARSATHANMLLKGGLDTRNERSSEERSGELNIGERSGELNIGEWSGNLNIGERSIRERSSCRWE